MRELAQAVEVWCFDWEPETWPDWEPVCRSWLPADELKQVDTYQFPWLRRQEAAIRGLGRWTLSRYTGVNPNDWQFERNKFGKPRIAKPAEFAAIEFNSSKTRGMVCCAVTCAGPVGVDVEDATRAVETDDIIRHFFSETEVEQLMKLGPAERRTAFFRYWVLKEAYVKSRGIGISFGLDQFTIRFDSANQPSVDGVEAWQLALHRFSDRHELGLAIAPHNRLPVAVNWNQTQSLLST